MPGFNNIKQRLFLTIAFLPGAYFCGLAQSSIEKELPALFNNYSILNFQEKIFAHTDKSFYVCGEIIWFKLYNVDAYLNKPLALSKIAYVELLSRDHKPVLQAKIELNLGTGSGSFMVPFSLNSGVYVLRAYTNWMKNFSPDLFFETSLTIINSLKKLPPAEKDSSTYDIRFFPEGGDLVEGLQSKVAFHAVGRDGRGIDCKGIIVNQRNETITSFQALRFGMGNFDFTPAKENTYKAIIKTGTGKTITRNLPPAFKNGFVMKLSFADKDNIRVSVFSGNAGKEVVFLLVHTRAVIKKAETKTITNGSAEFIINKKELAKGISHFTVFNERHQPVCERLYFQAPEEKLNIGITSSQPAYSIRKKVDIELSALDMGLQHAKADLSLSVFPIDSLQILPEPGIQSYLWLGSELRGRIEDPSYYFNPVNSEVEEAADNLMLTQGWSRFKWEDVLSNKPPSFQFLPEYEGMVITGIINERLSGTPAKNIATYLTVPGQKFLFKTCTSDQNGKIIFNLNKFYGNNEVVVQAYDRSQGSYSIDIVKPFSGDFSSLKYPLFTISEKWQDQLLSYSVGTQVENMYVQHKKQQFYFPGLKDMVNFYGSPDKIYWLDDYTRFITMEEVMREYVMEVRVRKQQDKFTYQVRNLANKLFFDNEPLVLLDGLPVFDINKIIEFNPLKVKRLEVVTRKYISGTKEFEGIVSYSTYKGDLEGFQLDPKALVLDYPGLQLQREFYSPIYETKQQVESRIPDFRNLLYWSPNIKTDEKGNSKISFYTSDRPGKYAVIVQGISSNGEAGSKTVFFTVNK